MRSIRISIAVGVLLITTTACDRPSVTDDRRERGEKTDQAARRAGEDAYKAAAKAKQLAREAEEKIERAGREARGGLGGR
jgi:hypothetical protein